MTRGSGSMKRWAQSANETLRRSLGSHTSSSAHVDTAQSGPAARYTGALNKQWVHPPDALQYGRVEYGVKFLGECEVTTAKGTSVVREAVEKIRYSLQLQRAANGNNWAKLPKVEVHINIEGVSIIDGKSKVVLYKYPLHRISFCADDKQDRRVFAFIAKRADSDRHDCYVFLSEKAEEITLTVGEAFDLAYRKFLERSGSDIASHKQMLVLQRRIAQLEQENELLRAHNAKLGGGANAATSSVASRQQCGAERSGWHGFSGGGDAPALSNDCYNMEPAQSHSHGQQHYESAAGGTGVPALPDTPVPRGPPQRFTTTSTSAVTAGVAPAPVHAAEAAPSPPPVAAKPVPAVRKSLQHSQSESSPLQHCEHKPQAGVFDDEFDPRGETHRADKKDSFGLDPFNDDFFTSVVVGSANGSSEKKAPTAAELEHAINAFDSRLNEMRLGFERGLQLGADAETKAAASSAPAATPPTAAAGSETRRSDETGGFGVADLLKEFASEGASSP